jgi:hypothetical protein
VFTIGMRNEAELSARVFDRQAFEQTFLLEAGREALPVRTAMIGDHHIYNCLAAAAVAADVGHRPRYDRAWPGGGDQTSWAARTSSSCGQPFNVFVDAARAPIRSLPPRTGSPSRSRPCHSVCWEPRANDARAPPASGSSYRTARAVSAVLDQR